MLIDSRTAYHLSFALVVQYDIRVLIIVDELKTISISQIRKNMFLERNVIRTLSKFWKTFKISTISYSIEHASFLKIMNTFLIIINLKHCIQY